MEARLALTGSERAARLPAGASSPGCNAGVSFATLRDAGYQGWLSLEAVHQDYMNTLTEDVITETIAMRDSFHAWMED